MEQKFKSGDKVRIINYGHLGWTTREGFKDLSLGLTTIGAKTEYFLMWGKERPQEEIDKLKPKELTHILKEEDGLITYDCHPEYLGKEGIVEGSYHDLYGRDSDSEETKIKNMKKYSLTGIRGKSAWYDEQQLELIEKWQID